MSEQIERFRSIIQQSLNLGRTEFKKTLNICDQLLNPPPEPSEEEIIELAKGPLLNYSLGARITLEEKKEAKRVPGRITHQGIMKEVRDRLW